jgi:hypothetical protein
MPALHLLFKLKAKSLKPKINAGAVRCHALKNIQNGFVKTLYEGIAI